MVSTHSHRCLDLPSGDPDAIRRSLVLEVLACAEGDVGLFYSQARGPDDRFVPVNVVATAWQEEMRSAWQNGFVQMPDPLAPSPRAGEAFLAPAGLFGSREAFEDRPSTRYVRQRFGLGDQTRLLAYHGGRFLGWIGAFRNQGAPYFGATDRRRLSSLVKRARALLAAADTLEAEALPNGPAYLVVSAEGQVLHASEGAQPWLQRPQFNEALKVAIRACDRGEGSSASVLDRAAASISRMDGPAGVSYLVCVKRSPSLRLSRVAELSPTQRRVAEYIAAGAQRGEVASALGLGAETVRSHLKAVYERLGVANRLELVRALAEDLQ